MSERAPGTSRLGIHSLKNPMDGVSFLVVLAKVMILVPLPLFPTWTVAMVRGTQWSVLRDQLLECRVVTPSFWWLKGEERAASQRKIRMLLSREGGKRDCFCDCILLDGVVQIHLWHQALFSMKRDVGLFNFWKGRNWTSLHQEKTLSTMSILKGGIRKDQRQALYSRSKSWEYPWDVWTHVLV